jgi:hypothetical protein
MIEKWKRADKFSDITIMQQFFLMIVIVVRTRVHHKHA